MAGGPRTPVGAMSSLKKFYTMEVEKSKKPPFSKQTQAKTALFTSSPRNDGEQRLFTLARITLYKVFANFTIETEMWEQSITCTHFFIQSVKKS